MIALDAYYSAISQGFLPGTVPISCREGTHLGIATVGVDFSQDAQASAMILSANAMERAAAAVLACVYTTDAVERQHELLSTPSAI